MADANSSAAQVAEAVADEPVMFEVTLKASVSVGGVLLKPGQKITATQETVTAMGDAVDHVQQV